LKLHIDGQGLFPQKVFIFDIPIILTPVYFLTFVKKTALSKDYYFTSRWISFMENMITEVRIFPKQELGKTLAFANITIMDQFVVKNLRVVRDDKGIFIGMPSNKKKNGEYVDIFFPITQEAREYITKVIVDKYEELAASGLLEAVGD